MTARPQIRGAFPDPAADPFPAPPLAAAGIRLYNLSIRTKLVLIMLKLGKLTDYATVLMTVLAADPALSMPTRELAKRTHVAPPTVRKLLKLLARQGLVESSRGSQGGYRLARPSATISVADIVSALEGPIALTQCSVHRGGCTIEPYCGVRSNWRLINRVVRAALEAVSLEQMAAPLRSQSVESPLVPSRRLQAGAL